MTTPQSEQTQFEEFRAEVLANALVCGSSAHSPARRREKQVDQVTAAAVVVVSQKGLDWCSANPDAFVAATWEQLGIWTSIGLVILGYFTGGSTWLMLLRWVLPIVFRLLDEQRSAGGVGAGDFSQLAEGARRFIEKKETKV